MALLRTKTLAQELADSGSDVGTMISNAVAAALPAGVQNVNASDDLAAGATLALVDATDANVVLSLPVAGDAGVAGIRRVVKLVSTDDGHTCAVTPEAGEGNTVTLTAAGDFVDLVSDGTAWVVINSKVT